ncbi:DUF1007 family protein [Amaricoccus sp.]|uniref:DUF1007 family protein n=1 Tax=Amaricoccus sp. TaxID=1872485 RepID=UPI001B61BD6B|nr:DUF1007 family protein [Amaricoccus sp.]MBP7000930.1 DUF1007 family protein [Amaricoccus sp.]
MARRQDRASRGRASRGGTLRAAAVAALLAPGAALAHPHVFIDGGVDFLFDPQGRLSELRVTWVYDAISSHTMLEDLGIDAGKALTADEETRLAAYQTEWVEGFAGDSYLSSDGRPVGLGGPEAAEAEVQPDGRAVIRFNRRVAQPFRPRHAVVEVYDPTYFTGYAVTDAPRIEGPAEGCAAEVEPFKPTERLVALQLSLAEIGVDEDPKDDVGALFADKVRLECR